MSGGGQPYHHIPSAADVNVFFSIVKAKIGAYIEDYIVGVCVTSRSRRNHHACFIVIYC